MAQSRSHYLVMPVLRHADGTLAEAMGPYLIYARSPRGAAFLVESMAEATRKGFLGCHDDRGTPWPDDTRALTSGDKAIVTPVSHDGRAHRRSVSLIRTDDSWEPVGVVAHTGRRAS